MYAQILSHFYHNCYPYSEHNLVVVCRRGLPPTLLLLQRCHIENAHVLCIRKSLGPSVRFFLADMLISTISNIFIDATLINDIERLHKSK